MARPRKEVNQEECKKLCSLHCTRDEIAGWFSISHDTLERRLKEWGFDGYASFFKMYSADGKISLRRAQYTKAIGGNAAMLIWLGKQYLGQQDNAQADGTLTEIRDLLTQKAYDSDNPTNKE